LIPLELAENCIPVGAKSQGCANIINLGVPISLDGLPERPGKRVMSEQVKIRLEAFFTHRGNISSLFDENKRVKGGNFFGYFPISIIMGCRLKTPGAFLNMLCMARRVKARDGFHKRK